MRYSFLFLLLLIGCYNNHLYVQQEKIDRDYLASSQIGTPDPLQDAPPEGQQISVSWDYPLSWYRKDLRMALTVRFWDNTQQQYTKEIERRRGITSFFFSGEDYPKILTYQIQVLDGPNEIIETWKHQFWTPLIDLEEDKISSAQ